MLEVLKQMVEALECALGEDKPYIDECKQAIKAGKQAIKELESQEPVAMYREKCADGKRCLHGCHTNEPCYTHPPQRTEQEPLAIDWERIAKVQNAKLMAMCDEAGGFEKLCEVMNKYKDTHPPQRKPLEVDKDGWFWLNKNECIHVDLIRKIEAAHGIKEKNNA